METEKYGRYFWCVLVDKSLSDDGEIYVMADAVAPVDHLPGAIAFVTKREPAEHSFINLLIPAGSWRAVYAASVIDGSAIAVERWAGQILPPYKEDAAE